MDSYASHDLAETELTRPFVRDTYFDSATCLMRVVEFLNTAIPPSGS